MIDKDTKILYFSATLPFPFAERDFVLKEGTMKSNVNSVDIYFRSIKDETSEAVKSRARVRATIEIGGFRLERSGRNGDKTAITYLLGGHLNGLLAADMMNRKVIPHQLRDRVDTIREFSEKLKVYQQHARDGSEVRMEDIYPEASRGSRLTEIVNPFRKKKDGKKSGEDGTDGGIQMTSLSLSNVAKNVTTFIKSTPEERARQYYARELEKKPPAVLTEQDKWFSDVPEPPQRTDHREE